MPRVSRSRSHFLIFITCIVSQPIKRNCLLFVSSLKCFEQENVYRSHSPRIARSQQVILHPGHFVPGQQLTVSQRQYSAKALPFPLLSEISASGLTAPHIVIRPVHPIAHNSERPANLSLCSHLCRPTLYPGTVLGARANWCVMNTVVALPL